MTSSLVIDHKTRNTLKVEDDDREEIFSTIIVEDASSEDSSHTAENEVATSVKTVEEDRPGGTSSGVLETQTAAQKALANPVILKHLFGLCPAKTLASCKLVNKQWYDDCLVTWRSSVPLKFTFPGFPNTYVDTYDLNSAPSYASLHQFLKYVEQPENQCNTKPHHYIKFFYCHFKLNDDQFAAFWTAVGKNLITLELNFCWFEDVEEFRKVIFKYCPNLKRLILNKCSFLVRDAPLLNRDIKAMEFSKPRYGEHRHLKSLEIYGKGRRNTKLEKLPISWLEILSHFQSLTSFKLDHGYCNAATADQIAEFEVLASAVQIIRRQNPASLPFKSFYIAPLICISRNWDHVKWMETAQRLRLPLAIIGILSHPEVDIKYVKTHLDFHAKTVKILSICQEAPTELMREFPFTLQLQNLREMELEDTLCENFTFLLSMPNLNKLFISNKKTFNISAGSKIREIEAAFRASSTKAISNTPKDKMAQVEMHRLTKLTLGVTVSEEDILSLFKWMPNLLELTMCLNDRQFSIICDKWRRLKRLKVTGNWLTDKGVTGRMELDTVIRGIDDSTTPNITNLQDLKVFDTHSHHLTEYSVFNGFLKLPKLQEIGAKTPEGGWGLEVFEAIRMRELKIILYGYY